MKRAKVERLLKEAREEAWEECYENALCQSRLAIGRGPFSLALTCVCRNRHPGRHYNPNILNLGNHGPEVMWTDAEAKTEEQMLADIRAVLPFLVSGTDAAS